MKNEAMRDDDSLWTVKAVATYLNCSVSKVYKLAEAGGIPCFHVGALLRFHPRTVREWATTLAERGGVS